MRHSFLSTGLLACALGASAQTRVDLGNQSKNIDFSGAAFVRPFPIGTALPATCQVGQMFFLTTAPAGVSECASTNTWTPIQGTSSLESATIDVKRTSNTLLTIGSSCSIVTPCLFRLGSTVHSLLAPSTVTLNGGSGLILMYFDTNANLTVGISAPGTPDITCSGCVVVGSIAQYPLASIPLGNWNAAGGSWNGSGTDNVAVLSGASPLIAGSNVTITDSGGIVTISATGGDTSGGSGSGGSGGTSGGSALPAVNPMDPTQFYLDHLMLTSGIGTAGGWTYSGGCANASGSGLTGFSQETIVSTPWMQVAGAGTPCVFFFPSPGNGVYGFSTFDYWSGSTPAQLWVSAIYKTLDTNGTHYIGLSSTFSFAQTFIGCRQSGAGNWFAVIQNGGVDVATADTGVPYDNLPHRLSVDNAGGTANTIRCIVDGGTPAAAVAAVPAETFGWNFQFGAVASGTPATVFAAFQYTIFLQGLPRL